MFRFAVVVAWLVLLNFPDAAFTSRYHFGLISSCSPSKCEEMARRIEAQKRTICFLRDGIFYQNKCYWLVLHNKKDLTFSQAQAICSSQDGELGDILDSDHFSAIEKKARAAMRTSFADLWTGMIIHPPDTQVYLSNGHRGYFEKWISSVDPLPQRSRTKIPVTYSRDVHGRKGIWNVEGGYRIHGALCQDKPDNY